MSNVITGFVVVAVLLIGAGVLVQGAIKWMTQTSDAWTDREARSSEIVRTNISVLSTDKSTSPYVDITLKNVGQTPVRDFTAWDVIVEYYEADNTYHQVWMPYTTSAPPGSNKWTVTGLYLDAGTSTVEKFQPNILDPEEEMVIRVELSPVAGVSSNNRVVISTPNGVSVSSAF